MNSHLSRRTLMQGMGITALSTSGTSGAAVPGLRGEGTNTPKICMILSGRDIDEAAMRRVKQLGVDYVLMGGPRIPWEEAEIRSRIERLRSGGLTLKRELPTGI